MLSNFPKVRLGIYFVSLLAQVASIFAPVWFPELVAPLKQTADYLGVLALGTAVSNTTFSAPAPPVVNNYASTYIQPADGKHEA